MIWILAILGLLVVIAIVIIITATASEITDYIDGMGED